MPGGSVSADGDKTAISKSNKSTKPHAQLPVSLIINFNFSMRPHGD